MSDTSLVPPQVRIFHFSLGFPNTGTDIGGIRYQAGSHKNLGRLLFANPAKGTAVRKNHPRVLGTR